MTGTSHNVYEVFIDLIKQLLFLVVTEGLVWLFLSHCTWVIIRTTFPHTQKKPLTLYHIINVNLLSSKTLIKWYKNNKMIRKGYTNLPLLNRPSSSKCKINQKWKTNEYFVTYRPKVKDITLIRSKYPVTLYLRWSYRYHDHRDLSVTLNTGVGASPFQDGARWSNTASSCARARGAAGRHLSVVVVVVVTVVCSSSACRLLVVCSSSPTAMASVSAVVCLLVAFAAAASASCEKLSFLLVVGIEKNSFCIAKT